MSVSIDGAIAECKICRNFSIIKVEKWKYFGLFLESSSEECFICEQMKENKMLLRDKKLTDLGI